MVEISRRRTTLMARTVLAFALAAIVVWPATAAHAASGQALCVVTVKTSVNPAFSLTTMKSSFLTSNGATGSASCFGTAHGSEITGLGTASLIGVVSGNCLTGKVLAQLTMTVGTKAGPVTVTVPFNTPYVGGLGSVGVPEFNGTYLFSPSKGDCALVLASEFSFNFVGNLTV